MALVFNPSIPPQENPRGRKTFLMTEIQFGDGYSQAFGDGINNSKQSWPLEWRGTEIELMPIKNFLDQHEGYVSFLWTPPYGVQGLYVAKEYDTQPFSGNNMVINVTLEQVFR